jgi:hypothetical protein
LPSPPPPWKSLARARKGSGWRAFTSMQGGKNKWLSLTNLRHAPMCTPLQFSRTEAMARLRPC